MLSGVIARNRPDSLVKGTKHLGSQQTSHSSLGHYSDVTRDLLCASNHRQLDFLLNSLLRLTTTKMKAPHKEQSCEQYFHMSFSRGALCVWPGSKKNLQLSSRVQPLAWLCPVISYNAKASKYYETRENLTRIDFGITCSVDGRSRVIYVIYYNLLGKSVFTIITWGNLYLLNRYINV